MQVPDTQLAERFYGQALGLTADPGSTAAQRGGVGVTWYNIGKQQVRSPYLSTSAFKTVYCSSIRNLG